ncbi:hypothetical protein MT390_09190 [Vibrio sp. 2-Bac 85]
MKLTLHIGTRKTGTTSIQAFLRKNRKILFENGIFVLDYLSLNQYEFALAADISHNLKYYIEEIQKISGYDFNEYSGDYYQKLQKELNALPEHIDHVIVSSEDCSLLDNNSIIYLKNKLSSYFEIVEIISYFRRQDRYVTSNVTTALRSGYRVKLNNIFNTSDIQHLLYNEMMTNWANSFGKKNITCRVFEKEKLINNDLIIDFLNIANIKSIENLDMSRISTNESIDIITARCIEVYNNSDILSNELGYSRNELIKKINNKSESKFLPARNEAIKFQSIFMEENKNFMINFFEGHLQLFNNIFDEYPEVLPKQDYIDEKSLQHLLQHLISEEKKSFEYMKTINTLNENVEFLNNLAKRYEILGDNTTTLSILKICQVIRPNGEYINKKIKKIMESLNEHD